MRVLVTGANGHIGCNLVRELEGRGHDVVALVRPKADVRGLQGTGAAIVEGDVLDEASVERAAKGCEAILNLAAIYKTGQDPATIVKPAVDGIRNVLRVAARLDASRVVHTSSVVAVGSLDHPGELLDHTDWNDAPQDAYYQAKTDSERQAWIVAKELGVPLVCVNPSGVLGPWDFRRTPSSHYVEELAAGRQPTIVGALNYVDVRDVALVHALALEKGAPGERYLCTGPENLDFRDLGARITALTGRPLRHLPLPRWAMLAFASASEAFDRLRGAEPTMTRSSMSEVAGRWSCYDATNTREAFGWTPRPLDDTLALAIRWGIFMGRVPADALQGDPAPDPSWVK